MTTGTAAPAASAPSTSTASSTPSTSSSASTSAPSTSSTPSTSTGSTAPKTEGTQSATNEPGAPQTAAQTAAAKAEEARKWKLKVLGQEREVDEGEMIRRAQLGYSADEKFQEAKQMRETAQEFFKQLKTNPLAILQHPELGIDFRKMAEDYLAGELKREMLPPEQRELEELRSWKQEQEAARQAQEQEQMTLAQQQEYAQLTERATQQYSNQISEVLNQTNLPRTPYTIKRVAEMLKTAMTKGYELDVQTAVDMVRDGYMTDFKSLFGGLKGDKLAQFLGDDVLKEVRQFDLARLKAKLAAADPSAAVPKTTPVTTSQSSNQEPKQMKQTEWLEHIRKKAGV